MKIAPSFAAIFAYVFIAAAGGAPMVIAPCDCLVMKGEERWSAKTDPQPAPINTANLARITPADMCAWSVPTEPVTDARIEAEQKWYALVCRIVAMKLEADGDLHIEVENVTGGSGRVVVELPCGETWCEMRKHVVEWTKANSVLQRGKLSPVSPHNVTVVGKAFFDIDHANGGKNERRGKTPTAVWEIHPVMKVLDGDARLGGGL
jgi:hypothetical protein